MPSKILKVYLSAGHGVYFDPTLKRWVTQRRGYWGVVEDAWTVLLARELFVLLDEDKRFQVFMNRDFFNEEVGESGFQKWMQGSHLFFQEVGAPESIWNAGNGIVQAILADAQGISYYDADLVIGLHANCDGGESYGYEIWHHSAANLGRKLALQLGQSLQALPTLDRGIHCDRWHDARALWRQAQGRVMAVINYFFYDHPIDNEQMKQQKNITLAAQLTYQGIVKFVEIYGHQIPKRE